MMQRLSIAGTAIVVLLFLSFCFRAAIAGKKEYDLKSVFLDAKNYIEEIGPSGRPSAIFFKDPHYKNYHQGILNKLTEMPLPSYEQLKDEERLAFWINLHNLYVIKTISDHYPVRSNRYISAPLKKLFDLPELEVFGKKRTINGIQIEILKKEFKDPRIPFCLYMGAKDGPPLSFFPVDNQFTYLDNAVYTYVRDNCMINGERKFIVLPKFTLWWFSTWATDPLPARYVNAEIIALNRPHSEKIILSFLKKYLQFDRSPDIPLIDPKIKLRFKRFNWSIE